MKILKTSSIHPIGNNGLTRVGDSILLGGIITGNTAITIVPSGSTSFKTYNGTIDGSFLYGSGFAGGSSSIQAIGLESDETIYAGGNFTTYQGTPANNIISLNRDGSINTNFFYDTGFDLGVGAIAIQSDGKILVGGYFTTYQGNDVNQIIRLNTDGSVDGSFNFYLTITDGVISIAIQDDGKILVAHGNNISRVNSDGTSDGSFSPSGFNNIVYVIKSQPDGKILVGGQFTTYGVGANRIIRLNSDGSVDTSFVYGTGFNTNGSQVLTIALQPDGKILVGGYFQTYQGVSANYIIRLNINGSRDTSFVIGTGFNYFSPQVNSIVLQSDGKVLVGGQFNSYNGVSISPLLTRLNSDGSLDTTYVGGSGFNNSVSVILVSPNDTILVGGGFTTYNSTSANNIIRLNGDIIKISNAGLSYGSDFSGSFTQRSIPDVSYVTGLTASISPNAGSGLSKFGNTIQWGGIINQDVNIGDNGSGYTVFLGGGNVGNVKAVSLFASNGANNSFGLFDPTGAFSGGIANVELRNQVAGNTRGQILADEIGLSIAGGGARIAGGTINWNQGPNSAIFFPYDNSPFLVTDTGLGHGLQYAADYSANFTPRSLVDAAYVTGYTSTNGATASNGLSKSGNTIVLGGTLTGDTKVKASSAAAQSITFGGDFGLQDISYGSLTGDSAHQLHNFTIGSSDIHINSSQLYNGGGIFIRNFDGLDSGQLVSELKLVTNHNGDSGSAILRTLGGTVKLGMVTNFGDDVRNYGEVMSFQITNTGATGGMIFNDKRGQSPFGGTARGVEYAADYSPNYSLRSLVDMAFVTGLTSGGAVTADNGLTKTGNDIQLGGDLIQDTTVFASNGYAIKFGDYPTSSVGNFNVFASYAGTGEIELKTKTTDDGVYLRSINDDSNTLVSELGVIAGGTNNGRMTFKVAGFKNNTNSAPTFIKMSLDQYTIGGTNIFDFTLKPDTHNGAVFTDNRNSITWFTGGTGIARGIEYGGDYSAGYTSRSLVDKGYVDGIVSGGSFTLTNGNGTSAAGSAVNLGGSLTQATTITQLGNDLTISGGSITLRGDFGLNLLTNGTSPIVIGDNNAALTDGGIFMTSYGNISQISGNVLNSSGQTKVSFDFGTGSGFTFIAGSNNLQQMYMYSQGVDENGSLLHVDIAGTSGASYLELRPYAYSVQLQSQSGPLVNGDFAYSLTNKTWNIDSDSNADNLAKIVLSTTGKNGNTQTQIQLGTAANAFKINDARTGSTQVGIEYGGDYSVNYTSRSLVDAAYVTGQTVAYIPVVTQILKNTTLNSRTTFAVVSASISAITVTLSVAGGAFDGFELKIKDVDGSASTNNITINGNGQNIDGAATALINTDYGYIVLTWTADADQWLVTG